MDPAIGRVASRQRFARRRWGWPFRSDRVRGKRVKAAGWRLSRAAPEHGGHLCRAAAALLRRAA
jgi:hypothetical protein